MQLIYWQLDSDSMIDWHDMMNDDWQLDSDSMTDWHDMMNDDSNY